MNIAFLRHGPTEWSTKKRLQGRRDVALSEHGQNQVRGWTLPQPFDDWPRFSSPLMRCRQTADLLSPAKNTTIESALIECDFGQFEGRTLTDLRTELGPTMQANEALGLDFQPPDGESPRQVRDRLSAWLGRMKETTLEDKGFVAVTHKGVIRAALSLATEWDMIEDAPLKLRWQHLHHFQYGPDEHQHGGSRLRLVRANISLQHSP